MSKFRRAQPFHRHPELFGFSAGTFASEGTQGCQKRTPPKRGERFIIQVAACSKDLVTLTALASDVAVVEVRARAQECAEQDKTYFTRATDRRAKEIGEAYKQVGLLTEERERKIKQLPCAQDIF